eukprot:PhF_6_TR40339/c0_g1_i2/m.59997
MECKGSFCDAEYRFSVSEGNLKPFILALFRNETPEHPPPPEDCDTDVCVTFYEADTTYEEVSSLLFLCVILQSWKSVSYLIRNELVSDDEVLTLFQRVCGNASSLEGQAAFTQAIQDANRDVVVSLDDVLQIVDDDIVALCGRVGFNVSGFHFSCFHPGDTDIIRRLVLYVRELEGRGKGEHQTPFHLSAWSNDSFIPEEPLLTKQIHHHGFCNGDVLALHAALSFGGGNGKIDRLDTLFRTLERISPTQYWVYILLRHMKSLSREVRNVLRGHAMAYFQCTSAFNTKELSLITSASKGRVRTYSTRFEFFVDCVLPNIEVVEEKTEWLKCILVALEGYQSTEDEVSVDPIAEGIQLVLQTLTSLNPHATLDDAFVTAQRIMKVAKGMSNDEKLRCYALFKQATEGDNTTSRPWAVDMVGTAKWDAWTSKKGMTKQQAMQEYVSLAELK